MINGMPRFIDPPMPLEEVVHDAGAVRAAARRRRIAAMAQSAPPAPLLGIIHRAELYGWPLLLDFMFDRAGCIVALRPRLLPPDTCPAHGAIAFRLVSFSAMLEAAGGAVALLDQLVTSDAGERAIIEAAARLESLALPIITEAHEALRARLAREREAAT